MIRTLMRSLRCRRGSVAMMVSIVAIPMIGVAGLGTELGVLYATKRHAQSAADSAAYAGGLTLASGGLIGAIQSSGKQFAAQNAFCNPGDTSYTGSLCVTPPARTTQSVAISRGNYAAGVFTANASGQFVQAIVGQSQPPMLSSLFLAGTVNVSARAIAQVQNIASPCVLALTGSISFQGSPTINAPNCGLASDSSANNAINFTGGGGIDISNVGSISAVGGCSGSLCANVTTYMPRVTDPLSALQSAVSSIPTLAKCSGSNPVAYTAATPCRNDKYSFTGSATYTLSGTYFFSGNLKISGSPIITGTVTFIMLPGSSLTITGTPSIRLTAQTTVPASQLPTALQPVSNLLSDLLLYDPDNASTKISGDFNSFFNGIIYAPNAPVDFQGNASSATCTELIAASVQFAGNPNFNNTGCPAIVKPQSQAVLLVQ